MNGQQLRAFLWLHWRLRVNQIKRAGTVNAVILAILAVAAVLLAAILLVVLFFVGLFILPKATAPVLLLVWDGVVLAFLFSWAIGLVTELQRSEIVGLERFLLLPVTLTAAFLVSYLSSLLSITLILFVPAMVGLSLGLVFGKGPAMILLLPLVAAFLLMVTAVTYQFQGWLASLMVNKRRRRTIIVLVTGVFILLCQLPNLLNVFQPWNRLRQDELSKQLSKEQADLQRSLSSGEITAVEFKRRQQEILRTHGAQVEELSRQTWGQVQHTAGLVNLVLPPGWLPLGAMRAAEGKVLPALLGTLGMTLIGTASLWRAYSTTVKLYTGQFTSGKPRPVVVTTPAKHAALSGHLLERELPWLSEHVTAIALASFRSLLRAPEAKMMLLTPVILVVIFGAMLFRRGTDLPEAVPPLMAFGGMSMVLLSMVQLVGNQFGFDRSGFRVFVLCSARRRDILLGKNLAVAPLILVLDIVVVGLLQAVYRMPLSYVLATLPQLISMYLLFCLLANCLSILAPMAIAAGSFKPAGPKGIPFLLHLAFLFLFPLALVPTLLPLGIQFVLERWGYVQSIPICLLLSLVECVAVFYLYRLVLTWQGDWLYHREQRILEIVTTKVE